MNFKIFFSRFFILFFSITFLFTLDGCKQACKKVTCKNGGYCDKGVCICKTQWFGEHCDTFCEPNYEGRYCNVLWRQKFLGKWNCTSNTTDGKTKTYYIDIQPSNTDIQKMVVHNLFDQNFICEGFIYLSNNVFDIRSQTVVIDSKNASFIGNGQMNPDSTLIINFTENAVSYTCKGKRI